jgi:hypothetical protein
MRRILIPILTGAAVALTCGPGHGQTAPRAETASDLVYDLEFFPGTSYDPAVATPEAVLGFRPGDRAAFPAEIERCLEAWKDSPRSRLVEYARSHEGRALYYVAVSSPDNIERLDAIRAIVSCGVVVPAQQVSANRVSQEMATQIARHEALAASSED